ncbi:MAG: PDZ domain-containing protein [Oscillospiraceae bacterium]|jgi:carboxyl-terminal processing protease|nr:PDZ domain-containing protein [Oscillospiraceae bacterium]
MSTRFTILGGVAINRKISLGITIALIAIAVTITFLLTSSFSLQKFNDEYSGVKATATRFKSIEELNELISKNYYSELDRKTLDSLLDNAMIGYVSGIGDKYSVYYSQAQLNQTTDPLKNSITGIGIDVKEDETGYIKILQITSDTPAQELLKVDDIIVKIDDEDILDIGYANALKQIRLKLYDGVELTVRRNGIDEKHTFANKNFEQGLVSGEMLHNNLAYIKIVRFDSGAAELFKTTLNQMQDDNAKGLVIDLRGNGGGLISETEKMLDWLLPQGEFAKATFNDNHEEIIVSSDENYFVLPVVLLTDSGTASSAELFAAVLRDFRSAKLIGERSFGKGIMQKEFSPQSGGLLVLTVATIRSNNSPSWNGLGLLPDYEVINSTEIGAEDKQLSKAFEILNKGVNNG